MSCDNLSLPDPLPAPLHQRSRSVDSQDAMVVVQFIENGSYGVRQPESDDSDYDHLLPRGDFDHLCHCTYGRVSSSDGDPKEEERHLNTISM